MSIQRLEMTPRRARLDELLASNRERFKCPHGVTMNVPLEGGSAAGKIEKCECCRSSFVPLHRHTSRCLGCREENTKQNGADHDD